MAGIAIGVDCRFEVEGAVLVRRISLDGRWITVEQGRQWVDRLGRHVLILLPQNEVREILLNPKTMSWLLLPADGGLKSRLV